ncbi:MAG: type II toxin-antitoxin system VapC family toxin [Cytophagales bacterium]|nr:type II toxin-antitoxin system VapC family toxin [Cytophagales bacterium]
MGERFLLDTSAVIKYLNETLTDKGDLFMDMIVDDESIISVISRIELLSWNPDDPNDLKVYETFIEGSEIKNITEEIILKTIKIRKQTKVKLADAIIAATAIVYDLTLIADNDRDFKKVKDLKYINPNKITKEFIKHIIKQKKPNQKKG